MIQWSSMHRNVIKKEQVLIYSFSCIWDIAVKDCKLLEDQNSTYHVSEEILQRQHSMILKLREKLTVRIGQWYLSQHHLLLTTQQTHN